jgi:hypothetical protein
MQDIVIPIGDFLVWAFGGLEALRNYPNMLFTMLGFFGLFVWLRYQIKFNKQAANDPTKIK